MQGEEGGEEGGEGGDGGATTDTPSQQQTQLRLKQTQQRLKQLQQQQTQLATQLKQQQSREAPWSLEPLVQGILINRLVAEMRLYEVVLLMMRLVGG